jgi:citronellyl-CoA synthetase
MFRGVERLFSKYGGMVNVLRLKKEKPLTVGKIIERQAHKRPDKNLILFENRAITYKEFNEAANRYADLFSSRGFVKGDTVALLMENRPEYLIIHAGLSKIGVVPALVNNNIRGKVLARALNIVEAKALIIGHELLADYLQIAGDVILKGSRSVFIEKEGKQRETPDTIEDLTPLLNAASSMNPADNEPLTTRSILEYIYTSGTTGMPKATVLTHHKWIQLGYALGGLCLNTIPRDVIYCCLPLYHNSGINIAWPATVVHGATLALRRKFSASNFIDDVRKYKATLFVYIGELCRYLNNKPSRPDDGDNPLEYILGNGMRADYWIQFQKRFDIKKIIECYGSTEGVGGLINMKGVPGMIGRLTVAGVRMGEVARYDAEKQELIRNKQNFVEKCKLGEKGMFLAAINKNSPFSGYKGDKKATNEKIIENVFTPGDKYFISGDLFQLHKKDYVSFVDRLGDSYKWKGELVATNEVADVLNKFGCFEDCNVYGVTVKNAEGRAGMAALTLRPGSSLDWNVFAEYVIGNLPVYARPYFVRLRKEKDATSSFKQIKSGLQKEGFDPSIIRDNLYFLDPVKKAYVELTKNIYEEIEYGRKRF